MLNFLSKKGSLILHVSSMNESKIFMMRNCGADPGFVVGKGVDYRRQHKVLPNL